MFCLTRYQVQSYACAVVFCYFRKSSLHQDTQQGRVWYRKLVKTRRVRRGHDISRFILSFEVEHWLKLVFPPRASSIASDRSGSGNDVADYQLRKRVLLNAPELATLHRELVMTGWSDNRERVWDDRTHTSPGPGSLGALHELVV